MKYTLSSFSLKREDASAKKSGQGLGSDENSEVKEKLALMEASLYVSGRPLTLKTLGSVIGIRSRKRVLALAKMLAKKYSTNDGALELIELDDGRFVLQLKPKYVPFVKRLAMKPLLTAGPLKTLAYIAYRQPISQSKVASVRGSRAYSHIKKLEAMGLVEGERSGRTKILRTTDVFAGYFNLSNDARLMKSQLSGLFRLAERRRGR